MRGRKDRPSYAEFPDDDDELEDAESEGSNDEDEEGPPSSRRRTRKAAPSAARQQASRSTSKKGDSDGMALERVTCPAWPRWHRPSRGSGGDVDDSEAVTLAARAVMDSVLNTLGEVDASGIFREPVGDSVPGYAEAIPEPMEFSTMRSKLYDGAYDDDGDKEEPFGRFRYDLRLVVENCLTFNAEGSTFHDGALAVADAVQPAYLNALAVALASMPQGSTRSKRSRRR